MLNRKMSDISTAFNSKRITEGDYEFNKNILDRAETPEAFKYFIQKHELLSDYNYWFVLSTLWVSYTGFSDLQMWKKLFSSRRFNKEISLMKPSELKVFHQLPNKVTAYRVHREDETDWIAYTLSLDVALRFAKERKVTKISVYRIKKHELLALFLRRGESEVILLDKRRAKLIDEIDLIQKN